MANVAERLIYKKVEENMSYKEGSIINPSISLKWKKGWGYNNFHSSNN